MLLLPVLQMGKQAQSACPWWRDLLSVSSACAANLCGEVAGPDLEISPVCPLGWGPCAAPCSWEPMACGLEIENSTNFTLFLN